MSREIFMVKEYRKDVKRGKFVRNRIQKALEPLIDIIGGYEKHMYRGTPTRVEVALELLFKARDQQDTYLEEVQACLEQEIKRKNRRKKAHASEN